MSTFTAFISAWRLGSGRGAPTTQNGSGGLPQDVTAIDPAMAIEPVQFAEDPRSIEPSAPTESAVRTAFALGWHMAQLYKDASLDRRTPENGRNELPSLAALSPFDLTCFRVQEAGADLYKLRGYFQGAGLTPVSTAALTEELIEGSMTCDQLRSRVRGKHLELMPALLAADFRLGKAYVLGRGLAKTSLVPDDKESLDDMFGTRMVRIKSSLADLASILPDHTSRSVALSLRTWEEWVSAPEPAGGLDDDVVQWAAVRDSLRHQGDLWRGLLSGEKQAHDMLEPKDYVRAATRMMSRLAVPLAVIVGLLTVGIALLVQTSEILKVVGAFATALGAVGITGAGMRARLNGAARNLERGFWGAEMDRAVAGAVTVAPVDLAKRARKADVPARGELPRAAENLDVLERFRAAAAKNGQRGMRKLLHHDARFVTPAGETQGAEAVAEWLSEAPERQEIATNPERILAGRPGYFVVDVPGGTDVWRVREGQIRLWKRFVDANEARRAAGLAPEG
jgi:hypothetical protein